LKAAALLELSRGSASRRETRLVNLVMAAAPTFLAAARRTRLACRVFHNALGGEMLHDTVSKQIFRWPVTVTVCAENPRRVEIAPPVLATSAICFHVVPSHGQE